MEKLSAINIVNNLGLLPQLQRKNNPQEIQETNISQQKVPPITSSQVWPRGFLRERVETAPNLRKEIQDRGIEIEAASSIKRTIAQAVVYEGGKWVMRELVIPSLKSILSSSSATYKPMTKQDYLIGYDFFSQFGELWDEDLIAPDHTIRYKAVEKLKNTTLQEPQKFVQQVERSLRDVLLTTREVSNHKDRFLLVPTAHVIRGLFSILEALYEIDDDRICLGITMSHGWQETDPFISKINEQWYKDSNGRQPLLDHEGDTLDIPFLLTGRGWYEQNNVGEVIQTLIRHHHCFPLIDQTSLEIMNRILVRNWKIYNQYKIPDNSTFEEYRLGIYKTILETLVNRDGTPTTDDSLFLKTDPSKIPPKLQKRVEDFKLLLTLAALREKRNPNDQKSKSVVKILKSIFDLSHESLREALAKTEQSRTFLDEWEERIHALK